MTLRDVFELSRSVDEADGLSLMAKQFAGWKTISDHELRALVLVGNIAEPLALGLSASNQDERKYWSPDSPIIAGDYPYANCDVYKLEGHGEFFLVYEEFGGHRPELRCRYFDPNLVALG